MLHRKRWFYVGGGGWILCLFSIWIRRSIKGLYFNKEGGRMRRWKGEKVKWDLYYVLKVPNRAHGFYRRTNILKHGKPVYLNDEGTSLKSQFAYLFQRRRGPQKLLYSNKKIIILFPNLWSNLDWIIGFDSCRADSSLQISVR